MIKKISFVAIFAVLMALALAMVLHIDTMAYYSSVSGELRDSDTGALWIHGGSVDVFNCFSLESLVPTTTVDASGTFTISLPVTYTEDIPLCIEVEFNDGGAGKPGNAAKSTYPDRSDDSGNLDTGVYFTGTGPNAITVSGFAGNSGIALALLLPLAVLGSVVYTERDQQ